jgi:hypothetical protein
MTTRLGRIGDFWVARQRLFEFGHRVLVETLLKDGNSQTLVRSCGAGIKLERLEEGRLSPRE